MKFQIYSVVNNNRLYLFLQTITGTCVLSTNSRKNIMCYLVFMLLNITLSVNVRNYDMVRWSGLRVKNKILNQDGCFRLRCDVFLLRPPRVNAKGPPCSSVTNFVGSVLYSENQWILINLLNQVYKKDKL